MSDEQKKRWAKLVYDNKIRIEVKLRKRERESNREHRERVEAEVAREYGCGVSTLRAFKNLRRRPRLDRHPKFFDDLRKYGSAKFTKTGEVREETLGRGPDPEEFFADTPPGSDEPRG